MDINSIEEVLDEVQRSLPFEDYVVETSTHIYLGNLVRNRLKLKPGMKILDIGAGACDKTAMLSKMGYECDACDELKDPWHRTGSNRKKILVFAKEMGIRFHEGKAEEVLSGIGRFDLVMLNDVIEHLHESPRDLLNMAIQRLRPNGFLLVTMPNSVNLRKRLSVVRGRTCYPEAIQFFESVGIWRGHMREWTPLETVDLIRWMGLERVRVETFHGMIERKIASPYLRLIYRAFTFIIPSLKDSICAWGIKPEDWVPVKPPSVLAVNSLG